MNQKEQELNLLVDRGIISVQEKELLLAADIKKQENLNLQNSKVDTTSHTSSTFIEKLTTIGALMIGFGVIVFIATNWQYLPIFLKNIITIFSVVIFYGIGYYLRECKNLFRTGEALILSAAIVSGGAIALISQTYNVYSDNYGTLLLLWSLCVILPVYLFNSRTLSVFFALLLGITLQVNIFERFDNFSSLSASTISLMSCLILFSIGGLHYISDTYLRIGKTYRDLAVVFGSVSLWILTFDNSDYVYNITSTEVPTTYKLILVAMAVVSILLATISIILNVPKDDVRKNAHYIAIFLSIFAPLLTLFATGVAQSFAYSVIFVVVMLYVIYFGYRYNYKNYINFGLIFLGLFMFEKVIDILWELEGALFFIVTGSILVAFGYVFEKVRSNLLNNNVNDKNI